MLVSGKRLKQQRENYVSHRVPFITETSCVTEMVYVQRRRAFHIPIPTSKWCMCKMIASDLSAQLMSINKD
jgi:c-di-GMP-binding flagellar brake protein YcgR